MIRCQVDDGGDLRTEAVDVDQLVVGDLQRDVIAFLMHQIMIQDQFT